MDDRKTLEDFRVWFVIRTEHLRHGVAPASVIAEIDRRIAITMPTDEDARHIDSARLFFDGVLQHMAKEPLTPARKRQFRTLILGMMDLWFPDEDGDTAKSVPLKEKDDAASAGTDREV